jgi:hypothetical protein
MRYNSNGRVRFPGVEVSTSTRVNSFQASRKARTPIVIIAGAARGATM